MHGSDFLFLLQIVTLILFGRVLGELMQRIGQPSVMGQLLAGLLLGPSVFGLIWPEVNHMLFPKNAGQKAMLDGVSQIGVLLLLLLAGMETDLKLVRRVGHAAFSVSLTGIVLPFVCGFALGQVLPEFLLPHPEARLVASLFLGTALSISSVKIVAMVIREMNFMRRNVGQVILASAVIDDTVGWIIIAVTFSIAEHGMLDLASLARSIFGTLAFVIVSLTVGRRIVFWLIRWTNDNLVSEVPVISVILLIMGTMALTTHAIGVHTVLGAFMAGILIGESPILTRQIDLQLRGLIVGLFAPVFFGAAGLAADLTVLANPQLAFFTAALVTIASVGKFAGAFTGGTLGGMSARESLALACGMNARGSTEVIVATIGLSIGVLSQNLFTMIVAMAIITTMAMPPMLRWALARLPLRPEEKARLEREEFEAKGFLPNIERLLLAVDDSANGTFAARLTGMIAGGRGQPTTVIHVDNVETDTNTLWARLSGKKNGADGKESSTDETGTAEETLKAAAKTTTNVSDQEAAVAKPSKVDVISKKATETPPGDAVAAEAKKGYDLLVVGINRTATVKGGLHNDLAHVVAGFDGPLAVMAATGKHLAQPIESRLRIILPVNGTAIAHRAAEIAVAIARAAQAPIHVLYVRVNAGTGDNDRLARALRTRRHEEAILKDVVDLAERYDVATRTEIAADLDPDAAILRAARRDGDLIVMGVNRRPGEILFFGDTAAHVLEKTKASILFVAG